MATTPNNLVQEFIEGKIDRRSFVRRAVGLGLTLGSIEAIVAACGGSSGGSSNSASIKWSNWANTGEIQRFKDFTEDYNKKHNTSVKYNFVPSANNNYFTKLLTELNGGTAPDAFYVGDGDVSRLIANRTIIQLNDLMESDKSKAKPDDFLPGLWSAAKTKSGKIYGATVDCNPLVLWFNKKVLNDAGVSSPIDLYEQGKWTRDAFTEMLVKIQAKKKYGFILDAWTAQYYAWCTTNGGKVYDQDGYGEFVANQDPKSVDAFKWLADSTKSKLITYASSLPKGQGTDLAFVSNQVAFLSIGRWNLPTFKKVQGLEYDIVPLPSATGKIMPAPVPTAYMAINAKTKMKDQAFDFLTNFVSAEGQQFRLKGGGNAVPSVKIETAEKVVLEDNLPEHAQYLLDARNVGYALFPSEAATPALSADIQTTFEPVWLQGKSITDALNKVAQLAAPRIKKAQEELQ